MAMETSFRKAWPVKPYLSYFFCKSQNGYDHGLWTPLCLGSDPPTATSQLCGLPKSLNLCVPQFLICKVGMIEFT